MDNRHFPNPEASIRNSRSAIRNQSPPGLYLHIPFCRTKCPYCSFYSQTDLTLIPDFIQALEREMEMFGPAFSIPFDTVYIGGGTPSVLSPPQIGEILEKIRKKFTLAPSVEITLEANPGDLDWPFLKALRELGIHRLNLGVQSFSPEVLSFLGRRHTSIKACEAIEASRKAGFDRLGLDLIYAVPGQTMERWLKTLGRAVAFSPEHLSCYQLSLEEETPMGNAYRGGAFGFPEEEELRQFFLATSETLERAGYVHYEVSNFCRGREHASRHNRKYWDHSPYLGLGPSAHSFSERVRRWNTSSIKGYLHALYGKHHPTEGLENLSPEQLRTEAFFLGLRTADGIDLDEFARNHGGNLLREKENILRRLESEGLITIQEGRLRPTRAGLAVADRLALI
ncbi:MAG: radical SAM family heme chaperone HemW [Syntrophaceae bacterium]|nr:radical SAM family heme chaperone HemW [Syntrophaceae bacterium]